MTIFSDIQTRVLKSCWIPVLLAAVVQITYPAVHGGEATLYRHIFQGALLTLTVAWEFVIRKQYGAVFLLIGAGILVLGARHFLDMYGSGSNGWQLLKGAYSFIALLLLIAARFYFAGTGDRPWPSLVATGIYFFIPEGTMSWVDFIMSTLLGLGVLPERLRTASSFPSLILLTWCWMVCYYVIIYLTENSYQRPARLQKLQSKVAVWGRWEYLFVFVTVWFVFMGCIRDLAANIHGISSAASPGILKALINVFYLYLCGFLLRNILVARALTAGKHNLWLYALHNLPVLNIIPLAIFFFTGTRNRQAAQNASAYYPPLRHGMGIVVIIAGVLITLYNIYNMLVVPTGLRSTAIIILALLYVGKIIAFICLPASRNAVYVLTGLNVATVAFSLNNGLFLHLGLIYLSYYFLMELYHPQLSEDDAVWLSVTAMVGEEDEL